MKKYNILGIFLAAATLSIGGILIWLGMVSLFFGALGGGIDRYTFYTLLATTFLMVPMVTLSAIFFILKKFVSLKFAVWAVVVISVLSLYIILPWFIPYNERFDRVFFFPLRMLGVD